MRRLRRNKLKTQRRITLASLIGLTLLFSAGYAAFSTNIKLNAEGQLIEPEHEYVYARNTDEVHIDDASNFIPDTFELEILSQQVWCPIGHYQGEIDWNGCDEGEYFESLNDCNNQIENWQEEDYTFTCEPQTIQYEASGTNWFLRHTIEEDKVKVSEVGFLINGIDHYIMGGGATSTYNEEYDEYEYNNDSEYYATNKATLLEAFGEENCTISDGSSSGGDPVVYNINPINDLITPLSIRYNLQKSKLLVIGVTSEYEQIECRAFGITAEANTLGYVNAGPFNNNCYVYQNGTSQCYDYSSGGGSVE